MATMIERTRRRTRRNLHAGAASLLEPDETVRLGLSSNLRWSSGGHVAVVVVTVLIGVVVFSMLFHNPLLDLVPALVFGPLVYALTLHREGRAVLVTERNVYVTRTTGLRAARSTAVLAKHPLGTVVSYVTGSSLFGATLTIGDTILNLSGTAVEREARAIAAAKSPADLASRAARTTTELAAIGTRLRAFVLDVLVTILLFFAYLLLFVGVDAVVGFSDETQAVVGQIGFAIPLLYFIVLEAKFGTTLGKAVFGLRVVRAVDDLADAPAAGPIAVVVRNLLRLIDNWLIGLIVAALTERHQRLGDFAARTVVVQVTRT